MTDTPKPKQKRGPKPGTGGLPDEQRQAARVMYETDPNISTADIARELTCGVRTVQGWAKDGNWTRATQPMTKRAHLIADQFRQELRQIGDHPTPEQKEQVAQSIIEEDATGMRGELLARHRNEWNVIRGLLVRGIREAQKAQGFEAAKFAKISSETLKLIQDGERRAWGLDKGDGEHTVIIERS